MRATRIVLWPSALIVLALALACCPFIFVRAETGTSPPDATPLFLNSRETTQINGRGHPALFEFIPVRGGLYVFRTFHTASDGPNVSLKLYREGEAAPMAMAKDEGPARVAAQLEADVRYALAVDGASADAFGYIAVEVMLDAHARSFDRPISLSGESERYTKKITQPRDTHWYSFVAAVSGLYTIRTESAEPLPLDVQGYLMDAEGVALKYNDDILFPGDPNFLIHAHLEAGNRYMIRVNALSNKIGTYRLAVVAPDVHAPPPRAIALTPEILTLPMGQRQSLKAELTPANALPDVTWASSDYRVATVSPEGEVRAVGPGEARIHAIIDGASAETTVTVPPIPLEAMRFESAALSLHEGDAHALVLAFSPIDATDQTAAFTSSHPEVVAVDAAGGLRALSVGTAQITAVARDGGWQASMDITVLARRPAMRALILCEQTYVSGRSRVGGVNTAQGLYDALMAHGGEGYAAVEMRLDNTYEGIRQAVDEVFSGAKDDDISLIYMGTHADVQNGVAFIELHDGTRVLPGQFERIFRNVSGKVVLLFDFCNSGAFIGKSVEPDRFGRHTPASDPLATFGAPFASGRYSVMTSASYDQKSYRLGNNTEREMYTVFGKSICDGLGWNLLRSAPSSLRADRNGDRAVTFEELFEYVRRQSAAQLIRANRVNKAYNPDHQYVMQTPQMYTSNGGLVLFERPAP